MVRHIVSTFPRLVQIKGSIWCCIFSRFQGWKCACAKKKIIFLESSQNLGARWPETYNFIGVILSAHSWREAGGCDVLGNRIRRGMRVLLHRYRYSSDKPIKKSSGAAWVLLQLRTRRCMYAWMLPKEKDLAKAILMKPNSFLATAKASGQGRRRVTHTSSPTDW